MGDRVWLDEDFDGLQDSLEPGIEGVRVDLWSGSTLVEWTTSDSAGEFRFRPEAGDYYLEFELPAIYAFTLLDALGGGADGVDSDADPASGETIVFAVQAGVDALDWDAGLVKGRIGDFVWVDDDGDGIQDGGEPGLAGVSVRVFDPVGTPVAGPVLTGTDGLYGFTDLPQGFYYLELTPPSCHVFTGQDQGGDDTLDSDVVVATGRTAIFAFAPGNVDTSWDAGLIFEPSCHVFSDGFESGNVSAWSSSVGN